MAARNPKPQTQPEQAEQPGAHSPEALQHWWNTATARRTHAVQIAEELDACDAYIVRTREALAKAEADRVQIAGRHAEVLAEADQLRVMVVEFCAAHSLPLPLTPAPEPEPPAAAATVPDLERARKHPAPAPVRARSVTEIVHLADPYAHLVGRRVSVFLHGGAILVGVLINVDAERLTLADDPLGEAKFWPARSTVERVEPIDGQGSGGDDTRPDDPYGGDPLNQYGQLPERPAETRPEVGELPAEARALALGLDTWTLLTAGLWLAARSARARHRHGGAWRVLPHRRGSLTPSGVVRLGPVPSGTVRGVTV